MQFVYDNYGNRTEKNIETSDFTAPISYNDENWDYTYDVYNRMYDVDKDDANIANYTFNALGNRVMKYVNASTVTTKMLFDGADCVADYNENDTLLRYYITPMLDENMIINVASGGSPDADYYYTHDGLGSVREILDSSQTTQNDYDYYAFGSENSTTSSLTNRFRFTGRELDSETASANSTALYYYRARMYDSETGSFASRDPIGGLNLYPYCSSNPINFIDSWGLQYCGGGSEESWREIGKKELKKANQKYEDEYNKAVERAQKGEYVVRGFNNKWVPTSEIDTKNISGYTGETEKSDSAKRAYQLLAQVCDKKDCCLPEGCSKFRCKYEAYYLAQTYATVFKNESWFYSNTDVHKGHKCYGWMGLVFRALANLSKNFNFKCFTINAVAYASQNNFQIKWEHNFVFVSLGNPWKDNSETGAKDAFTDCGVVFDPWSKISYTDDDGDTDTTYKAGAYTVGGSYSSGSCGSLHNFNMITAQYKPGSTAATYPGGNGQSLSLFFGGTSYDIPEDINEECELE